MVELLTCEWLSSILPRSKSRYTANEVLKQLGIGKAF
jgi:hypothetical protein